MKTFRLFISSTFSDFAQERDVLQTEVFPLLSKLCAKTGFGFMPIDLRWGVSEGAQLDQKTLELCLSEVRSCRSEPHPDFVILSGDRYGWIPLPYMIAHDEFAAIVLHISNVDKPLIEEWYRLDENQTPSAYILKKRDGECKTYQQWEAVENSLRSILQSAVEKSALSEEQKKRYFTSATELEFEEFKRRSENDSDSLFLVTRMINPNGHDAHTFIDHSTQQSGFKNLLLESTSQDHQISLEAELIDSSRVNPEYLTSFAEKLTEKLSLSILTEIERIKAFESQSEHDLHAAHKDHLSALVLGRDKEIENILTYIDDSTRKQPLILHGVSGIGKSAIMARSIDESLKRSPSKILYRFCGISQNSSSIKSLMITLLQEIGITIEIEKTESSDLLNLSSMDESKRDLIADQISDALWSIKEPTVLFIDAMDQLGDRDKLEWLPSVLPETLKIVISVLNDAKYSDDKYYYEKLTTLYSPNAFNPVTAIDDIKIAEEIITSILSGYARTLQSHQMEYVLERYERAQSPFFLKIIAEEVRHWNSETTDLHLADTSEGAVGEYIENLWDLYHHEPQLVQKALCYIYAARESISESQLYEILSNDTELIHLVENIYHENLSHRLPMVVWARLSSQLSSFLKEGVNGHLQFFHREFRDGAKRFHSYELSQKLLSILEHMIEDESYADVRENITEIHILTLTNQQKEMPDASIEEQCDFMLRRAERDDKWVEKYLQILFLNGAKYNDLMEDMWSIVYKETTLKILIQLYSKYPQRWAEPYILSLNNLGVFYNDHYSSNKALIFQEKGYLITNELYHENQQKWVALYTHVLFDLSGSYYSINHFDKAVELQEKNRLICKGLYEDKPQMLAKDYSRSLNNLALSYTALYRLREALALNEECLSIRKKFYKAIPKQLEKDYTLSLNNLAMSYHRLNSTNEALELQKEALFILKPLYEDTPEKWAKDYTLLLNNLAGFYYNLDDTDNAVILQKESYLILKELYNKNSYRWAQKYIQSLNNLAGYYYNSKHTDEAVMLQKEAISILKPLYEATPENWAENYTTALINLAFSYNTNNADEAVVLQKEAISILKPLYDGTQQKWAKDYTSALNTLALSYKVLNHIAEAVIHQEESLAIRRWFYEKDQQQWVELYIGSLSHVASSYKALKRTNEAIMLEEEHLSVLKGLYEETPLMWAEKYTITLKDLAVSYYQQGKKEDTLKLFFIAYQIRLEHFGENDSFAENIKNNYEFVKNELSQ
jgi:hypothetical protein